MKNYKPPVLSYEELQPSQICVLKWSMEGIIPQLRLIKEILYYTGFVIRQQQSLSPTFWKIFLHFGFFRNICYVTSVEIGCKSDQQGYQSTCSEQNTFYLVLIDALADALHSAYCYQKNWSSSARQIAETQLAAALGLWTRLPGKFTVARYGML